MSTINSKTARELLEAYHAVYQTEETITEEQLWEEVENWVNSLIEEGYDLSEYTWEDMYKAYIEEQGRASGAERRSQQAQVRANRPPVIRPGAGVGRGQGGRPLGDTTYRSGGRLKRDAAPKTAPAPAKQTGDKAKDMATWTDSNPKLAAAKAERDRTRGTSATTNPLMKDMKSRLPAPKTLSKTDAGANFGSAVKAGQSMNNKPAPTKTTPNITGMKSGRLATAISGPNKKIGEAYDAYDIVLNYIAENGHAESLDEAHYIMMEMSPEMIQDIVTECEVVNFLCVEGYVDTLEEAEWMMANIIDEEAINIILGEEQLDEISQKTAIRAYANSKTGEFEGLDSPRDVKRTENLKRHIKRKFGDKAVKHADRAAHSRTFGRKGLGGMPPKPTKEEFEAWLDEAMTNYEKNRKRAAQRAAARNAARDQGKTGVVPGVGYVTPRRERETWTDESGQERHTSGARMPKKDKK